MQQTREYERYVYQLKKKKLVNFKGITVHLENLTEPIEILTETLKLLITYLMTNKNYRKNNKIKITFSTAAKNILAT